MKNENDMLQEGGEVFDVLDCNGAATGERIARSDAHRLGVWHGAFHCLIIYERDNRRYALFQQRSSLKKIASRKFDVSVGGHYASGEDARTAGLRETREELGLDVRYADLVPLGRRVFVYCFTPGIVEHEFQDVFLLERRIQPEELALQREEVDGVLEMDVEEGILLLSGKTDQAGGLFFGNGSLPRQVIVARDEFVPCLDNYYLKLLLIARSYFAGERDLLVI